MTDPTNTANASTALTVEEVDRRVKETMMAQQSEMLEIAGRNALKLLREEQKKTAPQILDAMDDELEEANEVLNHEWRTQIGIISTQFSRSRRCGNVLNGL